MYSIVGTALLTGLYTIIGGLMAVVVTESIQTVVLLAGSILITIFGLVKVGGWSGIVENVDAVKLTMLRPSTDPAGYPWYSIFLGYPVIGLWYWCADQTIVQRVLGAKDENHARVGPLFAGFIKVLPVFIFVLPGIMLVALINQGQFEPLDDSKDAYAYLITNLLPTGLTGVMAAALLAALMSTVSGALNSIATLFSYDLYKRWQPDTSDKKLVFIGRIATFVAMIVAIFWSKYIGHFEGIYQGCISLICYVAPPITAVFLLGVFWKRASGLGSIVTLVIGSIMGFVVFLLEWFKETTPGFVIRLMERIESAREVQFSFDYKSGTGWEMPALLAGFYLCMVCIAIHIVVSLFKPHVHTEDSKSLVWGNPLDCLRAPGWKGIGDYRILSAILFVMMVVLYVIFR